MSFVGSMLGQNGTGLNFRAGSANVLNPSTVEQANQTFGQSQAALNQQQQFVQALQGQNGIGNQSSVFNQLQGVANGTGPNPAQAMLAQSTGANVANQAALAAGQRGSSANVGMISRQAANQGANLQQQAAGQAATMQANQSLGAMGQLAGIAGQQVGQQQQATQAQLQGAQAANQNVLQGIAGQNQANVSNMAQQNAANAGIAGIAAKGQQDLIGGAMGGAGSALGMSKGGKVRMAADGAPSAPTVPAATAPIPAPAAVAMPQAPQSGPMSNAGKHLAGTAGTPPQTSGSYQTGNTIGGAIGSGLKALFGGAAPQVTAPQPSTPTAQDWSLWAKTPEGSVPSSAENYSMMKNMADSPTPKADIGPDMGMPDKSLYSSESAQPKPSMQETPFARGGKVPAMVSPGEVYLPPSKVKEVKAKGNRPGDAIREGERIPGKAKVKGNSYANDTVPRTLEEGGVVIPKSVMEAKNPSKEAAKFVAAYMARGGMVPRRRTK